MEWNRNDLFLFLLIFSITGGLIGGALTFSRVLALILLPSLINLFVGNQCKYANPVVILFLWWFTYGCLSIFWTSDRMNGCKEIFYYFTQFLFFLEIISFAKNAAIPLTSISYGWFLGFFVTSIIAIWELVTDNHLSVSIQKADLILNMGENGFLLRHFASVTFGNFNGYVTYICYAFPFLLYFYSKYKWKNFSLFIIILALIIVGYNASRGGVISLIGMLCIFSFLLNIKTVLFKLMPMFILWFLLGGQFDVLNARMESMESSRFEIWKNTINLWLDTVYIGSGIGSIKESMKLYSTTGIFIPHNFFLEILSQFGFVIFIPVAFFLLKNYKDVFLLKDQRRRAILISCVIMSPVIFIINSSYVLNPSTAAFLASIYVFTYYDYIRYSC